jgi:hypothetical protein
VKAFWKYAITFLAGAILCGGILYSVFSASSARLESDLALARQSVRASANYLDSALAANRLYGQQLGSLGAENRSLADSLGRASKTNSTLVESNLRLSGQLVEIAGLVGSLGSGASDARATAIELQSLLERLAAGFAGGPR